MRSPALKSSVNFETRRKHRWQVFWQILFPLLLGIALVIFLFVLVLRGGSGSIERSAQTASILLSMPMLVIGMVFLFLLIMASLGLSLLMVWLPPQSYKVQKAARKVNSIFSKASHASRQPFLMLESWGDAFKRVIGRRG